MKTERQIYLIFGTDEWNSKPMVLHGASTTETGIIKCIHELIRAGEMDYLPDSEADMTREQQIELFDKDWPKLTRDQLNERLRMGYFDYTYDGDLY